MSCGAYPGAGRGSAQDAALRRGARQLLHAGERRDFRSRCLAQERILVPFSAT
jgi:hypothetical protein